MADLFKSLEELTTEQRKKLKSSVEAAVKAKRDATALLEGIATTKANLKKDDEIDPAFVTRLIADRYDQLYNASEGLAKIKNRADKISELDELFGTKESKEVTEEV